VRRRIGRRSHGPSLRLQPQLPCAHSGQPAHLVEPWNGEDRLQFSTDAGFVASGKPIELVEREERKLQVLGSDRLIRLHRLSLADHRLRLTPIGMRG